MKLFFNKINVWLLKNYQYGIALLVVSGFVAYGFRPITTFSPQATGVVESVRDDFYIQQRGGAGGGAGGGRVVHTTVFTINGVEYTALRREVFKTLVNKEITYWYSNNRRLIRIVYDGEVLNPPKRDSMRIFIPAFVLFILGLLWCSWVWVLKWRNNRKIQNQ